MNAIKKDWGGIVAKIQTFVPQEYCGCFIPVTENAYFNNNVYNNKTYTLKYIDVNGNGTYEAGERFYIADGKATYAMATNQTTPDGKTAGMYRRTNTQGEMTAATYGQAFSTNNNYYLLTTFSKVRVSGGYAYYWEDSRVVS